MDVAALKASLPTAADQAWSAGDPRTTSKGEPLEGVRQQSYCACRIGQGNDGELAVELRKALDTLEARRDTLLDLRGRGANFAFFVTWGPEGDSGETFDAEMLGRMAALGIALELNVLP